MARMKVGTVARVRAKMAADRKRQEEEQAKKRAYREYEASRRGMQTTKKPVTPLTPAQVRSRAASQRRAGITKATGLDRINPFMVMEEIERKGGRR